MRNDNTQKLWPILATTMFASFMNPFMLSAVNIALPQIQTCFNCNATELSWVTNSFLLANAIVLLPLSKASDLFGRVRFFKLGLYLFTLFTFVAAFSNTISMFLIFRALQGIGAAMMQVTGMAIVTAAYPPNKRGVALGLNVGAVYTGLSLGPFIGGILTQWMGWQMIFYLVAPLGAVSILMAQITLREKHIIPEAKQFDIKGSLIYALALVGIVYGGGHLPAKLSWAIWGCGISLFVLFFLFEKRVKVPVLDVELLHSNKPFLYSNLAALIHYGATFGVSFLLSLYLQVSKGLSPRNAGLILIVQPICMAISAPITGRLSDKIRPGLLASIGMFLTLTGLVCLIFVGQGSSIGFITAILIFMGMGYGLFTSPNTNAIMGAVEHKDYGIASGISATMRILGQTFSMMLVTVFMTLFVGKQKLAADTAPMFLQTMQWSFMIFATLCVPGIWFSINRSKPRK
jgi:EmrB/QacA subfamily drug resistance transporter